MDEIERRYYPDTPELRAEGDGNKLTLRGTGIVFNSWSDDLGGFREMVLPEAVDGLLDGDIRSFFNHDPSQVLGRTKSGTMRVQTKASGVTYELDLPDTNVGRDVHVSVKRGDVDGSSFAFTVAKDGDTWTTKGDRAERKIHKFGSILEMGPVSLPAYPRSTVSARAKEMVEKRKEEPAEPETPPNVGPRDLEPVQFQTELGREYEKLLLAEIEQDIAS